MSLFYFVSAVVTACMSLPYSVLIYTDLTVFAVFLVSVVFTNMTWLRRQILQVLASRPFPFSERTLKVIGRLYDLFFFAAAYYGRETHDRRLRLLVHHLLRFVEAYPLLYRMSMAVRIFGSILLFGLVGWYLGWDQENDRARGQVRVQG